MDDTALVAGLKAGDGEARVEFWRTYWDTAYPICARMLGSTAEATDTAVDLLIDFMEEFVHRLDEPRALRAYIRLTAVRRAQEVIRRRQKTVHLEFEPADEGAASAEEIAHWQALSPFLDGCLDKLTPRAQHALSLKYGQHLNNAKIGRMMGTSKQYISRLVLDCLRTLRRCIESSADREKQKR